MRMTHPPRVWPAGVQNRSRDFVEPVGKAVLSAGFTPGIVRSISIVHRNTQHLLYVAPSDTQHFLYVSPSDTQHLLYVSPSDTQHLLYVSPSDTQHLLYVSLSDTLRP
jgi:hypothetical protein